MSTISIEKSLKYGIKELKNSNIPSYALDAELLLGFATGLPREKFFLNQELRIKNHEWERFRKLIKKRKKNTPIAYLTGTKEFYGIDFLVNENVLVPRPETEILIDEVLNFCRGGVTPPEKGRGNRAPTILEIGTGSGCISLTLAKYLPKSKITTVDISDKTLLVARKNRSKLKIKNVSFKKSDLLSNIKTKPDIIVANLPYVTKKDLREPSISKEPRLALYGGGRDGLEVYRRLFEQIYKLGWHDIAIFIEIGSDQAKTAKNLISNLFPKSKIEVKKDLAERDRVIASYLSSK